MVKPQKIQKINQNLAGLQPSDYAFITFKTYKNQSKIGHVHTCQLNANQIKPQIQELIRSLKTGQKISYSQTQNGNNESTSKIVLELLNVQKGDKVKQSTQVAEILKLQGNQLIKDKKYSQASNKYRQALQLIKHNFTQLSTKIKINLISNLTLTQLNTNNYQKCIQMCQQYMQLNLEPNKKVIFRRAQAAQRIKDWDEALKYINLGLQVCQNDAEGKKLFQNQGELLKKQRKEQSQKQKKLYSKMFG